MKRTGLWEYKWTEETEARIGFIPDLLDDIGSFEDPAVWLASQAYCKRMIRTTPGLTIGDLRLYVSGFSDGYKKTKMT